MPLILHLMQIFMSCVWRRQGFIGRMVRVFCSRVGPLFGSRLMRVFCCGLLVSTGVTSCKQPDAPEYYGFQDLQIGAATGQQTTVSAIVKLYNPNPYNLELRRAEVDVAINGQHA